MQKNPCRVDDPLQNPIDRESYEDAVSLEDGIYPITTDDNTIISSDMVSHGSGTVEDALNSFEFGNQSTSGNDRTITLAHDYSAMTACFIQPISDSYSSNYTVKLPITFTAPRTVSFKIAVPDGSVAGAAIVCGFLFAGTRA